MRKIAWVVPFALGLGACGTAVSQPSADDSEAQVQPQAGSSAAATDSQPSGLESTSTAESIDPDLINTRVLEFDSYVPPQLIPPDGIAPVYDPEFALAGDAPLLDEELIIGIELNGEAKAYPITVLRFREMVNDELGGLPILVTW